MVWRIVSLSLLLFSLGIILNNPGGDVAAKIIRLSRSLSTEAQLALQQKLRLDEAKFEDLLLLPNVSDGLATNILKAKQTVLKQRCYTSESKALESVHGIAAKRAKQLSRYLTVECK